ncbi:MAG: radical SAM protein [Saprospirales bacterium]|nr:radical SAM protein [Saprospirales bacterium]
MEKILLINPPEQRPEWPTMPRAVEPMGLLYVAGAFRDSGVQADLLDLQLSVGDRENIYAQVSGGEYPAAGIALSSQACLWNALAIAQDLKNLYPRIVLFTGGVFASLNWEWILETAPAFDFVVVGEGEPFVFAFVQDPRNWKGISGVRHRGQTAPPPLLPARLLTTPRVLPDRSLTAEVIRQGEAPSVVATRGCGGACTFCCVSHYYGSSWQSRAVEDIFREVESLVALFGARQIHLVDDNLFGHERGAKAWIRSFVQAMGRFNPTLRFKTTCRLDDLDEDLIPDIKKAGFSLLKIGVETFSKAAQKKYKKGILREKAARKLDALREAGIGISLGFIMFDPYCSLADLRENLDFLLDYPECWSRHLLRSRLVAYRNTPIETSLEKDGLLVSRGIMGSQWRFGDSEVAAVYDRFEDFLRLHMLPLEWDIYRFQQSRRKEGLSPAVPRTVESQLKEAWLELFQAALENRAPDLKPNNFAQIPEGIILSS